MTVSCFSNRISDISRIPVFLLKACKCNRLIVATHTCRGSNKISPWLRRDMSQLEFFRAGSCFVYRLPPHHQFTACQPAGLVA
jgi:hypothetical protein